MTDFYFIRKILFFVKIISYFLSTIFIFTHHQFPALFLSHVQATVHVRFLEDSKDNKVDTEQIFSLSHNKIAHTLSPSQYFSLSHTHTHPLSLSASLTLSLSQYLSLSFSLSLSLSLSLVQPGGHLGRHSSCCEHWSTEHNAGRPRTNFGIF